MVLGDASISPTKVALETLCQINLASVSHNPDTGLDTDLHENIIMLAWEFVDNPLVKRTMCIESIENTFEGIRVALAYGTEDKGVSHHPSS